MPHLKKSKKIDYIHIKMQHVMNPINIIIRRFKLGVITTLNL